MDHEPPREPTVERVKRDDGRYIIYFSWPAGGLARDEEASRDLKAAPEPPAVTDE